MPYQIGLPDGRSVTIPDEIPPERAAEMIRAQMPDLFAQQQQVAPPPAEPSLMGDVARGTKSMLSSMGTAGQAMLGNKNAAAEAGLARQQAIQQANPSTTGLNKVEDIYDTEGIFAAGKEVLRQIPHTIAEQVPQFATTIAGAKAGAELGALGGGYGRIIGGLAGAALPSFIQQTGTNVERQAQTQEEQGKPTDINLKNAVGAAVPQAALDVIEELVPLGGTMVGKLFGPEMAALLKHSPAAAEKLAQEGLLKTAGRGILATTATEVPTEVTQQVLERAQAGLPLFTPDALREYGETAFQTALMGPIGIPGAFSNRSAARNHVAPTGEIAEIQPSGPPAAPPVATAASQAATPVGEVTIDQIKEVVPKLKPEHQQEMEYYINRYEQKLAEANAQSDPADKMFAGVEVKLAENAIHAKMKQFTSEVLDERANAPAGEARTEGLGVGVPVSARADEATVSSAKETRYQRMENASGDAKRTDERKEVQPPALTKDWGSMSLAEQTQYLDEQDQYYAEQDRAHEEKLKEADRHGNAAAEAAYDYASDYPSLEDSIGTWRDDIAPSMEQSDRENKISRSPVEAQMLLDRAYKTFDEAIPKIKARLSSANIAKQKVYEREEVQPRAVNNETIEVDGIERPATANIVKQEGAVNRGVNLYPYIKDFDSAVNAIVEHAAYPSQKEVATLIKNRLEGLKRLGFKFDLSVTPKGTGYRDALGITEARYKGLGENTTVSVGLNHPSNGERSGTRWQTVTHELAHAATMAQIRYAPNGTAANKLKSLHSDIVDYFNKKVAKNKDSLTEFEQKVYQRKTNSMLNPDELLAWGLTDPETQIWLDSVPSKNGTFLSRLFDVVASALGLTSKSNSALAELLSISNEMLTESPDAYIKQANKQGASYGYQENTTNYPSWLLSESEGRTIKWSGPDAGLIEGTSIAGNNLLLLVTPDGTSRVDVRSYTGKMLPPERLKEIQKIAEDIRNPKVQSQVLFQQAMGLDNDALPSYNKGLGEKMANWLSKASPQAAKLYFNTASVPMIAQTFETTNPKIAEGANKIIDTYGQRTYDVDTNNHRIEANLDKWRKVLQKFPPAMRASFNNIAHETTRQQVDVETAANQKLVNDVAQSKVTLASLTTEQRAAYELTKRFMGLPPALQQLYKDIREDYRGYSEKLFDRIEKSVGKGAAQKLRAIYESNRKNVYLPLFRKGDYWMTFQDKNNETVTMAFESPRERDMAEKAVKEPKYGATQITKFSRLNPSEWEGAPPSGLVSKMDDVLKKANAPQSVRDSLYQLYLAELPAASIKQLFQPRQGFLGYEQDVLIAYANTAPKIDRHLLNIKYSQNFADALSMIETEVGQKPATHYEKIAYEVLRDQVAGAMNPQYSPLDKVGTFVYYWTMAGNVSTAAVNLFTVPMISGPILAGKYGDVKAYKAIMDAMGLVLSGGKETISIPKFGSSPAQTINPTALSDHTALGNKKLSAATREMLNSLVERGLIRRSVGYEIVEAKSAGADDYSGRWNSIKRGLGWMMHNSERVTREVTAIAAHKLITDAQPNISKEAALDKVAQIIDDTHGTASPEMGPKFAQHGIGRMVYLLKRYSHAMLWLQAKLFKQAFSKGSPDDRRIARAQLLRIYAAAGAFAGIRGMPLVGTGLLLANLLHSGDDEPYDPEEELRNAVGETANNGVMNMVTGLDVATRTSMTDLLWRDDPRRIAEIGPVYYALEKFLGPTASLSSNIVRGVKTMNEGHVERGMESIMPATIRNVMKGIRYGVEGATTKNGAKIVDDPNAYESFMQILGFAPTRVNDANAKAGVDVLRYKKITQRQHDLLLQLTTAIQSGDETGVDEVREKIGKFNQSHPEGAIKPSSIKRSLAEHQAALMRSVNGVYLRGKVGKRIMMERRENEDDED
jgi:hypothetical protein